MDSAVGNFAFSPLPIKEVGMRAADGANVQIAQAIIQRTTALRAYYAFAGGRPTWTEKLSSAYVVALATRSADTYLMKQIQNCISEDPLIPCARCRECTIGLNVIRKRLFPQLASLRVHANELIHHLDDPKTSGVTQLNVEGVFGYCYHLFQENSDLLFGIVPEASFSYNKCKKCRAQQVR